MLRSSEDEGERLNVPGDATELWQWHQDVVNGRIQRR